MPVPAINPHFFSLANIEQNLTLFASIQPGDKVSLPRGTTGRGNAGLVRIDKPSSLRNFRIQGASRRDYDSLTHAEANNPEEILHFFEIASTHAKDSSMIIKAYRGVCNLEQTYANQQNARSIARNLKDAIKKLVKTNIENFRSFRIVKVSQGDLFENDPRLGEGVCHGFVEYWFKRIFDGKQNLLISKRPNASSGNSIQDDALFQQRMIKKFNTIYRMQTKSSEFVFGFMPLHDDLMDSYPGCNGYIPSIKKEDISKVENDIYKESMVQFAKSFMRKGLEELFKHFGQFGMKNAVTMHGLQNPDLPRLFFLYFKVSTKHHGGGHAMGLCVSRESSGNYSYHFFDPNIGEYLFRNQIDFINFIGAWTREFNRWFHTIKCHNRNPPREPLFKWDLELLHMPGNYRFDANPFKYLKFFKK